MTRRERRTASSYARSVWYNAFRLTRERFGGWSDNDTWPATHALRDLLDTDSYLAARIANPSCPLGKGTH